MLSIQRQRGNNQVHFRNIIYPEISYRKRLDNFGRINGNVVHTDRYDKINDRPLC